jgi:hypothetical protein
VIEPRRRPMGWRRRAVRIRPGVRDHARTITGPTRSGITAAPDSAVPVAAIRTYRVPDTAPAVKARWCHVIARAYRRDHERRENWSACRTTAARRHDGGSCWQ